MRRSRSIFQSVILLCCVGALCYYLHSIRRRATTCELVYSTLGNLPQFVVVEKLLVNGNPDAALGIAEFAIDQTVFILNSIINDQVARPEDQEAILDCLRFIQQRRIWRHCTGDSRDRQVLVSNVVNELVQKLEEEIERRKGIRGVGDSETVAGG